LSFLVLVGVLMGTVGGGALVFNFLVTAQIRSWNRISIFIAFFCIASQALLAKQWRSRTSRSSPAGGRHARTGLVLVALTGFVIFDQATPLAIPPYDRMAAEFDSDREFFRAVEAQLPAAAMVFQLPSIPFPEGQPLAQMGIYDHLRGYLHSEMLRWSFGGMRGRAADWQESLAGQPVELIVSRLAAVGFGGITVDRFGYHDSGRTLEAELTRLLGGPSAVSSNGRHSFFPLPSRLPGLDGAPDGIVKALAEQTLHPVLARPGPGLKKEVSDGDHDWLEGDAQAALQIVNPAAFGRNLRIEATVFAGMGGKLRVDYPDGTSEVLTPSGDGVALQRVLEIAPGVSWIHFATEGAGLSGRVASDPTRLELRNPAIYDVAPAGITSGVAR
ncbi:MAG: hypothetical protein ACRDZ7_06995, partial [Acidimicrobiia bacterium]